MQRIIVVIAVILCITSINLSCTIAAEKDNPIITIGSLSKYLETSGESVKGLLNAQPLDPKFALDKEILNVMKVLNEINRTNIDVYWSDRVGSSAHSGLGITLNKQQLQRFRKEEGDKNFVEIIRLILAHEQVHMVQYKVYNLKVILEDKNTRTVEAQADLLAGASLIWLMLKDNVSDKNISDERIKHWVDFIAKLGKDEWTQIAHPTSAQRARLISLGLNAGLQQVDLDIYKRTKDPVTWKRIKDAQDISRQRKRDERVAMKKVGFTDYKTGTGYDFDLPIIEQDTLEQENLLEWSNRLARVIVHYGDAIGGK
jgi:hypothetical protein